MRFFLQKQNTIPSHLDFEHKHVWPGPGSKDHTLVDKLHVVNCKETDFTQESFDEMEYRDLNSYFSGDMKFNLCFIPNQDSFHKESEFYKPFGYEQRFISGFKDKGLYLFAKSSDCKDVFYAILISLRQNQCTKVEFVKGGIFKNIYLAKV